VQIQFVKTQTTQITTKEKILLSIQNNPQITRNEIVKGANININTVKVFTRI
jgi:hypothetical protein